MRVLSGLIAVAFLAIGSVSLAEPQHDAEVTGANGAVVFWTLTGAHDAMALTRAGSSLAALQRVRCSIPHGTPLQVYPDQGDRDFVEAMVLAGREAGCRGYIVRQHVSIGGQ